jgi:cytidylate kinase
MIFDVSMTVIAGILSFVLMGQLQGVREGTVIAALLVGFIARTLGRILSFVPEKLYGTPAVSESAENENPEQQSICIAIGREYESGGHDYGKHLAQKLGFEFYDHSIIKMAAKELGFELGYAEKIDESMRNSVLFDFANQVYGYSAQNEPPKDALFEAESRLIKELAAKGNCVIVGRGCDYILKDHPKCLKLFLHAPLEYRTNRLAKKANLSLEEAQKQIHQNDKRRAENYHYYTRQIWGLSRNYDLSLDTTKGTKFLDFVITNVLESM